VEVRGDTRRKEPKPYTVNGVAHVFDRALMRAGITSSDVTLLTLRHTALSRMIAAGYDDYTEMGISGHSSTRMLGPYTHPTDARKIGALTGPRLSTQRAQLAVAGPRTWRRPQKSAKCCGKIGGWQEARTPDLRVANASGE
jgi:Phage integrase family